MNTKAESVILMIFELVVVIGVIAMTFQIATAFAKSETAVKINLAQDLQMMVNTLVGVPGDSLVELPQDASHFIIILNSNQISVNGIEDSESEIVVRNFVLPAGHTASGTTEGSPKICLKKESSGDRKYLFLSDCTENEP